MLPRLGIGRSLWLLVILLGALPAAGCAVRLIAPHDPALVEKTVQLQERAETLFLALEDAAQTSDPADGAFARHAAAYNEILVLLRVMEVRAGSLELNELTSEQLTLLIDSFAKMRSLHRQKSEARPPTEFSNQLLAALRVPFIQQVQAILKLQEALRR
jgi:hypothetical protein